MTKCNSKLANFADRILDFANNFEKIPNKRPEIIVLVLYPVLYWFFGLFHEPWFDEAQAWQIAKCASYRDILFYIPHFEGHPPLWHLILPIFAKNGFPYEISLKFVTFVFSYLMTFLIVLKSPFYRIIKILLPFCYFLFYQNTIISRPYCLVGLGFCLAAMFYQKKSIKYAFSLVLLALAHAYSFIISSFLTLFWFIEEIKAKTIKTPQKITIFFLLAVFYISMAAILIPSKEALAMSDTVPDFAKRLIFTLFSAISDCFVSFVCTGPYGQNYKLYDIILSSFVGILVWYFIYVFTKEKKLFRVFLFVYIPFAIFATKYFLIHHCTVIFCFIMFICWIALNIKSAPQISNITRRCFTIFVLISLCVNLYWSFKSCLLDVFINYSAGKKEADFIKQNNLDQYKIMTEWQIQDGENPNLNGIYLTVAPYFDKNIFYNFNYENPKNNYVLNKIMTKSQIKKTYEKWKEMGTPDVIVGIVDLEKIFPDTNIMNNYTKVYTNNYSYILKGAPLGDKNIQIFVKNNIASKKGLKPVESKVIDYKLDLFRITSYVCCVLFELKNKLEEKSKL